jgi:hypothetical protein
MNTARNFHQVGLDATAPKSKPPQKEEYTMTNTKKNYYLEDLNFLVKVMKTHE